MDLRTFSATELKNNLPACLEAALADPIKIQKNGRDVAVILSIEEYKALAALEDLWLLTQAKMGIESGFLSPEESMNILKNALQGKKVDEEG